jgi:hypothetical protein
VKGWQVVLFLIALAVAAGLVGTYQEKHGCLPGTIKSGDVCVQP